MSDNNGSKAIGYGKPPRRTQFVKGRSGNPEGVRVTENGGSRRISKFEATMLQLMNKAASGDLKAIRELLCWTRSLEDSEHAAIPSPVLHERDDAVMTSIVERIRQSKSLPSDSLTDPAVTTPFPEEEEKQ